MKQLPATTSHAPTDTKPNPVLIHLVMIHVSSDKALQPRAR